LIDLHRINDVEGDMAANRFEHLPCKEQGKGLNLH